MIFSHCLARSECFCIETGKMGTAICAKRLFFSVHVWKALNNIIFHRKIISKPVSQKVGIFFQKAPHDFWKRSGAFFKKYPTNFFMDFRPYSDRCWYRFGTGACFTVGNKVGARFLPISCAHWLNDKNKSYTERRFNMPFKFTPLS